MLPLLILLLTICPFAPADELSEMGPRSNLQIVLWETDAPGEKAALQELVFSFQRANPDVIVCLEWKDAQLQDDWSRRWCGAQRQYAPDVTVMTERRAYENRHELLELPGDFGRELRRDYARPVMRRLPGAARGVPWAVSTYALYYRTDLLADAEQSVPATPEALVEVAEALADPPNHYGLGLPRPMAGGERLLHALARVMGGGAQEAAADEHADREREEPDYASALELLVDLQSRGALQPETLTWGDAELLELFAEGRLAMLIAPISAARTLRAMEEPPEWAVAPLPMAEGGGGTLSVQWLVAFADTNRSENVLRFMRYMAEAESQRMLAMLPGVPATRELADELRGGEPWSAHIAALQSAEGVPLSRWERRKPQLGEAMIYALSGRLTAREALRQALEGE